MGIGLTMFWKALPRFTFLEVFVALHEGSQFSFSQDGVIAISATSAINGR